MKCEEVLTKIDAYINDTMSYKEMEEFLDHIKGCPECYDELETYYTISIGMKYLEEEKLEPYNIPKMLREDLARKEKFLRHRRVFLGVMLVLGLILAIGTAVFLIFYLGHIEWPNLF